MKIIHMSGKRKSAVARATLRPGGGVVRINSQLLQYYEPKLARARLMEPLLLAEDSAKTVDISVNVRGGGVNSQADAARLAIAKVLAAYDNKLQKQFLDYDRTLLVADVRLKETHKPNRHGSARSKKQKSYR